MKTAVEIATREVADIVAAIPPSLAAGVTVRRAKSDCERALADYSSAKALLEFARDSAKSKEKQP